MNFKIFFTRITLILLFTQETPAEFISGAAFQLSSFERANLTQIKEKGKDTIHYNYDPFGRRIQKTVGTVITQYACDGDDIIEARDDKGDILYTLIQGSSTDGPILAEVRGWPRG